MRHVRFITYVWIGMTLGGLSMLNPTLAASDGVGRVTTGRVIGAELRQVDANASIRGLRISNPTQLIIEDKENVEGGFDFFARLSGDFTASEDSVLMLNGQDQVAKVPEGKITVAFKALIPIVQDRTEIMLASLSPSGKMETLKLEVIARFEKANNNFAENLVTGWSKTVSLGPSLVEHRESEAPSFSAKSLTFKGGLDRKVVGPWSVGLFTFVTALPIQASIPNLSPIFLGVGLRGSYMTRWLRGLWSLSWSAGFYYTSLLGVDTTYGFTNIHGPQPLPWPTLTRKLSSSSSVSFTPKYSPIWATFPKGLNDHRQLAMSLRYTRQKTKKRSWFVALDYSKFDSKFESIDVTSTSWNLGVGVGF